MLHLESHKVLTIEAPGAASVACPVPSFRLLTPRRPWTAVFASAGLHCLVGLGALMLAEYLQDTYPASEAYKGFRVEWVHRDEPLLYAPPVYRKPEPPRRLASPPAERQDMAASEPPAPSSAGIPPSRRFELPRLPRRTPAAELLIQPQYPLDLTARQTRLPEMMFWSAEPPKVAPPAPKRFIAPGRATPRPAAPQLDQAPGIALPSTSSGEEGLRNLQAVLIGPPKLIGGPPARAPVRVFRPPAPSRQAPSPIDILPGDPASVLSLQADPAAMKAVLAISPGNRLGTIEPPAADQDGATAISARSGTAGPGGENAVGTGGPGGVGSSGTNSGAGGAPGGTAGGTAAPATSESGRNLPGTDASLPTSVPIRMVHPENGQFDIVVMQTSPAKGEEGVVLSGRPVYTVFVKTGATAEWILRYCVPDSSSVARQTATGVELGDPRPVKAPYPMVTIVPVVVRSAPLILHGFVTAQGKFRSLRAIRSEDEDAVRRLAMHLNRWDFRPAARGGTPIEVEVVLVIPPSS